VRSFVVDPGSGGIEAAMCGKCVVQSIECIRDCAIFGKGKQAGEQKRLIVAELVEKHREYNREGKRTQD
jgi:hypothetical protein